MAYNGLTSQFEKLFGNIAAEAGTPSGGDNNEIYCSFQHSLPGEDRTLRHHFVHSFAYRCY